MIYFSLLFSIILTESFRTDNIFAIYDLSYIDMIIPVIQTQLNVEKQSIFGKSIKYISFIEKEIQFFCLFLFDRYFF